MRARRDAVRSDFKQAFQSGWRMALDPPVVVASAVVVGHGTPPTGLPLVSARPINAIPIALDQVGPLGSASALAIGTTPTVAAAPTSKKPRAATISKSQKRACEHAFEAAHSGQDSPQGICRKQLFEQLARQHNLTQEQIQRQYGAYRKRSRAPAAADVARSSIARAASSGGADALPGTTSVTGRNNITAEQREEMLRVFRACARVWGKGLPREALHPTDESVPLMELIAKTGLTRDKLIYHYNQFLLRSEGYLPRTVEERRAEINGRLVLDEVVKEALVLAANHAMCKLNGGVEQCVAVLQQCVAKLPDGVLAADCRARLEKLVELVVEHTVCSSNEVKAAEDALFFAVLDSSTAWVRAVPDTWMITLAESTEASERVVKYTRHVINDSLYDALRAALHATRYEVQPFPSVTGVDVNDRRAPVLYYIAGWLLKCVRRDCLTRGAVWQAWLRTNCVDGETARRLGLPHELVTKRSRGGLVYASWRFMHLVWYLEQCYVSALTMEAMCVYGKDAVLTVHKRLHADADVLDLFQKTFSEEHLQQRREVLTHAGLSGDDIAATLDRHNRALLGELLRMYMRMRGRDAVCKLTAQARIASHDVNSLRSKLAAGALAAATKGKAAPEVKSAVTSIIAAVGDEFPLDEETCTALYDCVGTEAADAIIANRHSSGTAEAAAADAAGSESDKDCEHPESARLMALIEDDEGDA